MDRSIKYIIAVTLVCIAAPIATSLTAFATEPRKSLQNQNITTSQTMLSGIPIPGSAADAIAANFGSCNPNKEKDGLICTMIASQVEQTKIMGAPISSAKLTLKSKSKSNDGTINIRSIPISELYYYSVDFELANRVRCYDQFGISSKSKNKLHQGKTPSCWKGKQDFDYVRSKLAAAGWIATETSYMPNNTISFQVWYSRTNPLSVIMVSPSNVHISKVNLQVSNEMINEAAAKGEP